MVEASENGVKSARPRGGLVAAQGDQPVGGPWVGVSLGSNLGPRASHLAFARDALRQGGFGWSRASAIHQTAPVGGPEGQGWYLNQVLLAEAGAVALPPEGLLELALSLERERGRIRRERWGPRPLDIDLLFFGALQVDRPDLVIPHPRLAERRFVLAPLAELVPDLVLPGHAISIGGLLRALGDPA